MTSDLEYVADAAGRLIAIGANDALRDFKPHPKQLEFLNSDCREVMMLGANRTGKSLVLAAYIAKCVREDGIKLLWLVCPSFGSARQNMIPPLFGGQGFKPMIPESEVERIELKPEWIYHGREGWQIVIKSDEQGAPKFAGAAVRIICFDEPPSWPVYNECAIRFGAGARCDLRLAATLLPSPGQAGGVCQWLWSEKIEPFLNGRASGDLKIIPVAMADNPYITPEQLALARRLYPIGSLDYRIRVMGELLPGLIGSRAYSPFDRKIHVSKRLSRADIDPLKPLYIGFDFNVNPLSAVTMQKHGRIWRILDEFTLRPGIVDDLCQHIRDRYREHRNIVNICGDSTGNNHTTQTPKTNYELIALGLEQCFRLKMRVPEKNPPVRSRVNVVNYLLGSGGNEVLLEISHTCTETIADLEQVLWNHDASDIKKSHDSTDPYYQRTHHMDAAGYVVWAEESHVIQDARRVYEVKLQMPIPYYSITA